MSTKLKTLYSIVEGYKDLEMKMGEDTIFQMNEKEEEIIRTEILPIIGKDILLSDKNRDLINSVG